MSLMKSVVILLLSHIIFTANAQVNRPVGIKLSYVADYSTELVLPILSARGGNGFLPTLTTQAHGIPG